MQPSRRAFLTVGRGLGTAWGRFIQRLSLVTRGRLDDLTAHRDDPGLARLLVARTEDVLHARALCTECGVALAVADAPVATAAGPCLLLDASRLDRLVLHGGRLQAEPGVRLDALREQLPGAAPGAPAHSLLIDWLADPTWHRQWPLAGTSASALVQADLMLADGSRESFGTFGADARRPALSGSASRLVAELFTIASGPGAAAWRGQGDWPARYRLDALWAYAPNLAHLLLGGAGTLAWPALLEFEVAAAPGAPAGATAGAPNEAAAHATRDASGASEGNAVDSSGAPPASARPAAPAVRALEARVRQAFDPAGVWPDLPPAVV